MLSPQAIIRMLVLTLALAASASNAAGTAPAEDAHRVISVQSRHLDPEYWVARLGPAAEQVYLDADAIARQNAELVRLDDSVRDVFALPDALDRARVRAWIVETSIRPTAARYRESGEVLDPAALDALEDALALDAIPSSQPTRFGLVVRRAALRTFPTAERVFSQPGDTDIDRFQESALFPGDPVVVTHRSRDGGWLFVVSPRYAAWIQADAVAVGDRAQVRAYREREPSLRVVDAVTHTVYTPERPEVSQLQLDMGVRLPLADWPPDAPVNGQHPLFGHVIELPVRGADGSLGFAPALLPRTAAVSADPLPLSPANLIRQGFRFLGERYGWGHSYDARDCSGFVSEVYRSMGVEVPRNTRDQSVSPALDKTLFSADDDHATRMGAVARLQPGDLVYIPGHVMMVIGRDNGITYTIHDTTGIGYTGADGGYVSVPLNGVVVTPLEPLMSGAGTSTIDRITSIVRIR